MASLLMIEKVEVDKDQIRATYREEELERECGVHFWRWFVGVDGKVVDLRPPRSSRGLGR